MLGIFFFKKMVHEGALEFQDISQEHKLVLLLPSVRRDTLPFGSLQAIVQQLPS